MRISTLLLVVSLGSLVFGPLTAKADDSKSQRPYGIAKRVLWTTSNVKGSPEPPPPYRTDPVFRNLKFDEPLAMTAQPGSDRLFVVERYGKIYSFPNDPHVEKAELFLDLSKGKDRAIYGLAFHPNFETNGYLYITYVLDAMKELPLGTRVSRFRVQRDNPLRCDVSSETVMIEWPSGGHNGGCLKFGPDGYLYVATGDAAGIADTYLTGQDVGKLPGSILRIDVDHAAGGKTYAIPKDNPFVGLEGAREEIWALGLRQPWKMNFDRATGDLWAGNVGQDLWEQIFLIERGGNYGWSVTEGSQPFRPERKHGPTPILPPIIEHSHADFRSITGGFVYHGLRLNELTGAYIYGDYDTGRIWTLRYDGKNVSDHRELVDSALRLVGFAEDKAGELYLVDHMGGGIHQLVANPSVDASKDFPRKLSETGLFTSVKDHTPAPGLIPYSVTVPQWSDGAHKVRYLAIPGEGKIEIDAITFPQPAPGATLGWKFPDGTVIVETITMEMDKGNPSSRRRLETRILHHERLTGTEDVGDQYWRGYTYLWNDEQDEAVLLEDTQGMDKTYTIGDPDAPGGQRQQTWHSPSRVECTVCHNMAAKYVLGIQTLQMNKDHDYGGVVDNQLRTWEHLGLFSKPLAAPPEKTPHLVDYRDESEDLGLRARSYLHSNCSHCHRKWGGGNAEFQLLYTLQVNEMGTVGVRPGQGTFQIAHAEVLAPGSPERSIVFYRMAKVGPGRMPRIGSNVVDQYGQNLIHDWIAQLPAGEVDGAVADSLVKNRRQIAAALDRLRKQGDSADVRKEQIVRLLGSTGGAIRLMRAVDGGSLGDAVRKDAIAIATKHEANPVRDLFERFLPEEQRTKRLGSIVRPDQILALPGDVQRGEQVFLVAEGVQCKTCHKIKGQGTEVGPDLSEIGKKYNRAQLLETILEPSKKIEPKYLTYVVETVEGQIITGLLVKRTLEAVVLRDAKNQLVRVATDDIELLVTQQKSLMPDLLLREMTAEQAADLIAYLSSLK